MNERRLVRWLAVIFGGAGVLLCLGGAVGLYLVKDRAFAATEKGRRAVDDLLAGAQEGVAAAGPEVAALRERLVAYASGELAADLRAVLVRARRFLDNVARAAEVAAGILEAIDDRPLAATLRAHVVDLRDAARELAEFRPRLESLPRAHPALDKIETILASLHRELATMRAQVGLVHSGLNYRIGTILLLAGLLFLWMGAGQWCLLRSGR